MNVPADLAPDLGADPDLSMDEAVEIAQDFGCDAHIDAYDEVEINSDFVVNTIGFRRGDAFLYDNEHTTIYNRVVRTNQFVPGFSTCSLGAGPLSDEAKGAEDADWSEYGSTYRELWLAWLQGRVVPIEEQRTYVRANTGEAVEV